MNEAFPAFANNYRTLYSSILALSTSVLFASLAIATNNKVEFPYKLEWLFIIGIGFLLIAILTALYSILLGLRNESQEGNQTSNPPQRVINFTKFKSVLCASIFCMVGLSTVVISFLVSL